MDTVKKLLNTTLPDRVHYPATNQAHFCWQKYNEYLICLKKNDDDEDACLKARQYALSVCPSEWVENWSDQRGSGVFLGVQPKGAQEEKAHH